MRVLIKKGYSLINDLNFERGPVYVGRLPRSQVYLPSPSVSRQHAVLLTNGQGAWMVQDLESANRTQVNGRPISRMPLHEGDVIGIADYALEVHFGSEAEEPSHPLDLSDTVLGGPSQVASVYQTSHKAGHTIHLPRRRLVEYYELVKDLLRCDDEEQLIDELVNLLLGQFNALHAWAGLREFTSGPLTCYGGRKQDGQRIGLEDLIGGKLVKQAIKEESYILLPNAAEYAEQDGKLDPQLRQLSSAMAAPIVGPAGAYGVIYLDNAVGQPAYTPQDLDYLTLVSTMVAALAERVG